jgi:hypothetical protein
MLDDWDELHEEQVEEDATRDPRMQQAASAASQRATGPANAAQKKPVTSGNSK